MSAARLYRGLMLIAVLAVAAVPVHGERYNYDSMGRVLRVDYDDGTYVEYKYDRNGNLVLVFGLGPGFDPGETVCTLTMSSAAADPPNVSEATGSAKFELNESEGIVTLTVTHSVQDSTWIRIFLDNPGGEDELALDFGNGASPFEIHLAAEQYEELLASDHYLAVGSSSYPNGEIRADLNCSGGPRSIGDGNGDGNVDSLDATLIKLLVLFGGDDAQLNVLLLQLGQPPIDADLFDVDRSGAVDALDATLIKLYILFGKDLNALNTFLRQQGLGFTAHIGEAL